MVQALLATTITGGAGMIWAWVDYETLVGSTALGIVFFSVFFGLKLYHRLLRLPTIESLSQEEYDALKVLGKIGKQTLYLITEKSKATPEK